MGLLCCARCKTPSLPSHGLPLQNRRTRANVGVWGGPENFCAAENKVCINTRLVPAASPVKMAGKEPFIVKLFTTFFSLRAVCALAFFQSAIVLLKFLLTSTALAARHFCFPFAFKTRALFTAATLTSGGTAGAFGTPRSPPLGGQCSSSASSSALFCI